MIEQRSLERNFIPRHVAGAIHLLREEKEQAERAHHDKNRFLAVASHDLRQPIHALGLYVAELRRKVSGLEEQQLVGQVERSVDAIAHLINSLLDLSKLDAGTVKPNMRSCELSDILDRINASFQVLANARQIRLVMHPLCVSVISDPLMLERILMNLVSNALKYTPPHGTVLVACRRRGDGVAIEVRDNGQGIDKASQSGIFREYVQLNAPQMDAKDGLGLGLSIVDRLVKLLGHSMTLRSAHGMGSTFALQLGIARPSCRQKDALAGKRLLVVDGDKQARERIAMLLASWGCELSVARSLSAVRDLLKCGSRWDLLLCDCELYGSVSRLVRQPCILIGNENDKQTEMAGHPFLAKPVKPAKLRSLMQFLLENKQSVMR
jgi:two-component system, sensor histidine kinase